MILLTCKNNIGFLLLCLFIKMLEIQYVVVFKSFFIFKKLLYKYLNILFKCKKIKKLFLYKVFIFSVVLLLLFHLRFMSETSLSSLGE